MKIPQDQYRRIICDLGAKEYRAQYRIRRAVKICR